MKMMKMMHRDNQGQKTLAVLTIGALSIAPLLTAVSAQADPPSKAPAWGYVAKDKKKDDGHGKKDPDNRNITLRATVTSNLQGDQFAIRTDKGTTYRVIARDKPVRLSTGDRVEMRGWTENNFFIASSVKILSNRDWDDRGQSITLNGVVLADFQGESFQLRGTNGRTYIVVARNEPLRLSRNDRVQVQGRLDRDGRTIFADKVNILDNRPPEQNESGKLSFYGTVTRVASAYRIDVRADNNRNYAVNAVNRIASGISFGDRVHIVGTFIGNDTVRANQVKITSNIQSGSRGSVVNFPGRIESVNYSQGIATLRVRGDNNVSYLVRYRTKAKFSVGQRVRVAGRVNNGVVVATSITR